mgnify:CR=1 FL=1
MAWIRGVPPRPALRSRSVQAGRVEGDVELAGELIGDLADDRGAAVREQLLALLGGEVADGVARVGAPLRREAGGAADVLGAVHVLAEGVEEGVAELHRVLVDVPGGEALPPPLLGGARHRPHHAADEHEAGERRADADRDGHSRAGGDAGRRELATRHRASGGLAAERREVRPEAGGERAPDGRPVRVPSHLDLERRVGARLEADGGEHTRAQLHRARRRR